MINKTNLHDSSDSPDDDGHIEIIPRQPGLIIARDMDVSLGVGQTYSAGCDGVDQEVIYFRSGRGEFQLEEETVEVVGGDRIIVTNAQRYSIYNVGGDSLGFQVIGMARLSSEENT